MTRLKKKVLIAENKQFLVDVIRESLSSRDMTVSVSIPRTNFTGL